MISSDRRKDVYQEQIINKLVEPIYKNWGYSVQQVRDRHQQLLGIDVILENENEKLYIDEKAAIKYMDRPLTTFSFELETSNNIDNLGWFLNKDLLTTHYSLIYPFSEKNDINFLDAIEVILVPKQAIMDYVKLHISDLEKEIEEIKQTKSYIPNKMSKWLGNGMKIVHSRQIHPEQPINLIIDKKILKQLADKQIFVSESK